MSDQETGLKVIRAFYNYSKSDFPFAANYSFDELKSTLEARPAGKGFIESLGMSVRFAEMSDSKINSSMRAMAKQSGGKIPSKNSDFYNFMINEATKVSYVDAAIYTAKESAKDIVKGAQQVGDSLLLTGKLATWIFPVLVFYFGYMYLKNKTAK